MRGVHYLRPCFATLGVLIFVLSSNADTYYVSMAGLDSAPGTDTQPFLTIQKGVDSASPGDTIIVEDGTYTPPPSAGCKSGSGFMVAINRSGTPSAWITLKARNKWGAVLDGQAACHTVIYLHAAQYWNIEDFDVTRAYWWGVGTNSGASHFTIKGNQFHDIGRRYEPSGWGIVGVYAGDNGATGKADSVTIDGNLFYNIGRTGGTYLSGDHGIYFWSTNTNITNNIFYEPITGYEVQTSPGSSGNIANNTFVGPDPNNNAGLLVLWGANGPITVQNNVFYNPYYSAIHESHWSSTSCIVTNNIVYGTSYLSDDGLPNCTQSANQINLERRRPPSSQQLASPVGRRSLPKQRTSQPMGTFRTVRRRLIGAPDRPAP